MNRKSFILINICWLTWCHEAVLVAQVPHFEEVSSERGIADVATTTLFYGNGAAAADFDNDGDIDFYLTTDDGMNDRLYENDGTGHFTDIAAQKGIAEQHNNRAALWFDYDGDRRLDLVLAGENCVNSSCANPVRLALYRQMEDGSFEEKANEAGLVLDNAFDYVPFYAIGGFAAGDINRDGFLDLVFTVWGGGIKLFQNNRDGSFSDRTLSAGLTMANKTPWQAMLHDFNGDGWQDIYCNVDFAPNKLWINKGATPPLGGWGAFEDEAAEYGLDNAFNEMGMTIGDSDNDGDLDIYITNITRNYQGEDQYNILYEQQQVNSETKFKETAKGQGVSQSGWDWGTTFADINNDGFQDLLATNGLVNYIWPADSSNLWLNSKAGFVEISDQCGFNDRLNATTVLAFDMERDGDVDILQTLKFNPFTQKPARLCENRLEAAPNAGNYLTVQPRMDGPNHFAIGSVVTVVADGLISSRLISAGCSFYGQEPAEAHFGLGQREVIREIIVRWPTGEVSIYKDIAANQVVTLQYDFISPPTGLAATRTDSGVELTWKDNTTNETDFVLLKSETPDFFETKTISLGENSTQYTDAEATPSKALYYKVRAYKPTVFSGDSNTARVPAKGNGLEASSALLSVQPNPIQAGNLSIKSYADYNGPVQFSLFDTAGRLVWAQESRKSTAVANYDFPLILPSGMYLLLVKMGGAKEWQKVVFL
ncbi:MAG: VCBS repeat-containing protein [Saprospiraceae bacterium]|nr:VCBS repeat-containing protein [Saprospiraceae bacterium]